MNPFAPPACEPENAAALRSALQRLADEAPDWFQDLFCRDQAVKNSHSQALRSLESAGLVSLRGRRVEPRAHVVPFFGRFIATDLAECEHTDQVFPLMFEQVYLVRNLGVQPDDRVLELCVGSGANALAAADVARSVVGVDLNPRALAFAQFNATLNGGAPDLTLCEGDLFEPVRGEQFDLVFVNPPFEPVPPGVEWFTHSHGGIDGLDVIRRIVSGLPEVLAPDGRFEIITWTPGNESTDAMTPLIREALPRHDLLIHYLQGELIGHACHAFRDEPAFEGWQDDLRSRDLTHIHFVFVSARPSEQPTVHEVHPADEVARCRQLSDALISDYRT